MGWFIVSLTLIALSGCQAGRSHKSIIVSSLERTKSGQIENPKLQTAQNSVSQNGFTKPNSANSPHSRPPDHSPFRPDPKVQTAAYRESESGQPNSATSNTTQQATFQSLAKVSSQRRAPSEPPAGANSEPGSELVTVTDVVQSVFNHFPEVFIALNEIQSASGKSLSAQGAFDSLFSTYSLTQPLGVYKTQQFGVGLSQPLTNGGEVYSNYRIGDGNFEPWYGERETNEGGEFKAGFSLPLVKNRAIDKRRAKLFSAELNLQQIEADVDSRFLILKRLATQSYWDTLIAADLVRIQATLLRLAESRVDQIKERVKAGDLAEIAEIDNARFIAKRQNDLIKARRIFEKAAIKLSIYLRDRSGIPYLIQEAQLPDQFPNSEPIDESQLQRDIGRAVAVRPELDALRSAEAAATVELDLARNATLPKVDLKGTVGQDVGGLTSKKGDKAPFELQVGLLAEVPIQRRNGLGKIETAQGKLGQIRAKIQLQTDKIRLEIQDAASAINASHAQILQSSKNLELTRNALAMGKTAFENGDIDLLALNIYETSVATAQLQLLTARKDFLFFSAIYENAIRPHIESLGL